MTDALPTRNEIERAASIVYEAMPATPQYRWPLLSERLGTDVWVKHENHTPIGAFKVRGGLVYFHDLREAANCPAGVVTATRGNHGQSVGFAAQRNGLRATVVVPRGNSVEKNAAMRALGVEVIEHGHDFQAAREFAGVLGQERGLHFVPSFHPLLVSGVATCSWEFLRAVPELDVVYVPIGLGSGICGMMAARDALGMRTEIVGVVSAQAPCYALSFAARRPIEHPAETRIADGMACRVPEPVALAHLRRGCARVVQVSDDEIEAAMRLYFSATHQVVEGAGAAPLAAALQEQTGLEHRKVGLILSGGNVDRDVYARVIAHPAHPALPAGPPHPAGPA